MSFILQGGKWEATCVISLCNNGGKTRVSFFKEDGKLKMLFPFVNRVEKHGGLPTHLKDLENCYDDI